VGLLQSQAGGDRQKLALVGWCWCLFLLWSPGWSPQWLLYLLPLVLLLCGKTGFPGSALLVLVNLMNGRCFVARPFLDVWTDRADAHAGAVLYWR